MSIRMVTADIEIAEDETSKEVAERMHEHLYFFAKRHPEFSYEIIENRDLNTIRVKSVTLEDCAN